MNRFITAALTLLGGLAQHTAGNATAPLYHDPVTDRAANPCLVYNHDTKEYILGA